MQTCTGDPVKTAIVGETMDGCATACDAERGANSCVAFNYFGTGNTSLCFLLSSFDKAVFYTKCNKAQGFVQTGTEIKQRGSSQSNIKPWKCGKVGRPFQVVNHEGETPYTEILALKIATGKYEKMFNISSVKYEAWGIGKVNSCAINPADSKMYCTMKLSKMRRCVLARIDDEDVSFVARVKCGFVSGTFDAGGNLYYNNNKQLWTIYNAKSYDDKEKPFSIPDFRKDSNFPVENLGYDIATMEADFDGKGKATYVVGLKDSSLTMVRISSNSYKTFKLKATGETAEGGFGAAWNFNNQLYFANNDGKGVYQLEMDSVDLKAGSAKMVKVGSAMETNNNDGLGCPKGVSPFPPVLPPKPKSVEWMGEKLQEKEEELKVNFPTVQEGEGEEKEENGEKPKLGEVHCMIKLSKFADTSLLPRKKCKRCFKTLTKIDGCY